MADGLVLVVGLAALFFTFCVAAVVLRANAPPVPLGDDALGLGPAVVALGIILGEDPLVGYALITAGVILELVAALSGRLAAQ